MPNEIEEKIVHLVGVAFKNGFLQEKLRDLRKLFPHHSTIFETYLSSESAANVAPLKIDLFPDAKAVKVRLRNHSHDKREFFLAFVQKLVSCRIAYPNSL